MIAIAKPEITPAEIWDIILSSEKIIKRIIRKRLKPIPSYTHDDCWHDVIVKLHGALSRYQPNNYSAYLLTCVKNMVYDINLQNSRATRNLNLRKDRTNELLTYQQKRYLKKIKE